MSGQNTIRKLRKHKLSVGEIMNLTLSDKVQHCTYKVLRERIVLISGTYCGQLRLEIEIPENKRSAPGINGDKALKCLNTTKVNN